MSDFHVDRDWCYENPDEAARELEFQYHKVAELEGTLKIVAAERDTLAAHIAYLERFITDEKGPNAIKSMGEATTSLARRDEEQFRKGFWWGFERAGCRPEQHNIEAEWSEVKQLRRQAEGLTE